MTADLVFIDLRILAEAHPQSTQAKQVLAMLRELTEARSVHAGKLATTHGVDCWKWYRHHDCAIAEIGRLRALVLAQAERIAAQSEQLGKRSENK